MTHSTALLTTLAAGLAASAPAHAASAEREVERPVPRVAIAHAQGGGLAVHDARTGRLVRRLAAPGRSAISLTPLADARHVAVTQYDDGHVRVLDGGSWTEPHGDHTHSHLAAPRLTPFRLTAAHPTHVVSHGDDVSIFLDGDGAAAYFRLSDLARRPTARTTITSSTPHHGVSLELGRWTLMTHAEPTPGEPEPLPSDVTVRDASGREVGRLGSCPELHGEAVGTDWAAFACADGVVLAGVAGGGVTARKVPYPEGTPTAARAFTLQHDGDGPWITADLGEDVLVLDRRTGATRRVDLPSPRGASTSPVRGTTMTTLTADGTLHTVHLGNAHVLRSRKVLRPFDPQAQGPKPRLVRAHGHLALTEPARKRVHLLSATRLTTTRTISTSGTPAAVALVGTGAPAGHAGG